MKKITLTTTFCFATILAILSACGGGTNTVAAEGGISGTGITMGRIQGFGSIIVNGIRFDVSSSSFVRDGVTVNGQDQYKIGEIVTIAGSVNPDGVNGVASAVDFNDVLEGPVTQLPANGVLEVFGQQIETDAQTELYGFAVLTDLQLGNILEVSGYFTADGMIHATSINLKANSFEQGSTIEVKGTITEVNANAGLLNINNLVVDFNSAVFDGFTADQLVVGQTIEVYSDSDISNSTIVATVIELEDDPEYASGTELELEGLITRFNSATDFDVNGQPVTTTATTSYEGGDASSLALNVLLEVEGQVNEQGVLVAEDVSIESGGDSGSDD